MKKARKGLASLIEQKINWKKIEEFKQQTIQKIREIVDEELKMQIAFDANYIIYHDRIEKKLGLTEKHLYKPYIEDIYRKYENDSAHYTNNQRRIYDLMKQTRCSGKDRWIDTVVDQLETIGIRKFEKSNGKRKKKTLHNMIKSHFMRNDRFKVLSKTEWDEFVKIRDDASYNIQGHHNKGRLAWNSPQEGQKLQDRDPAAYKLWQERVNKGKAKRIKTRKERKKKNPMYGVAILSEEKKKQKAINISKALTGKKKSASHKQKLSSTRKKLFKLNLLQSPIKGKKRVVVGNKISYV